jgi:AcrR family transcriptional regulator
LSKNQDSSPDEFTGFASADGGLARWSTIGAPGKLPAIATSKRPTDRRERLLTVGVRQFARGNMEISTEQIAEQAGVAQGLLFHYFKTKRNFWKEVMLRIFDEHEAAFAANTYRDPARWLREELELFLFGLTEYPPDVLVARSGVNTDHSAIADARQERAASRLLERMAIADPSPMLYVALRGWVGFSLGAARKWLQTPTVTRAQILALLTETLHGTLEQVAELDPGAVDPTFFRPSGTARRKIDPRGPVAVRNDGELDGDGLRRRLQS